MSSGQVNSAPQRRGNRYAERSRTLTPAAPVPLPIDPLLPEIGERLRAGSNLILEAPPGAGKTTRVPPSLLSCFERVLVLEPRRLAARLAARRVAWELGEKLGETVGYQVRFEETLGPHTRLIYMTEGILTRRLLSDRTLEGVGCVVLDEFHERHLEGDLALALLRQLQRTARPDLRLVVMSATLQSAPVAEFLAAPVLQAQGRTWPVSVRFTPLSALPLEEQVAQALQSLLAEGLDGDVLVFLPGAAEIRRAARACEAAARRAELLVLPLHGDLSPEEQERAIRPANRRKLILSTNVAESSVTIEGVTAVIDSGLARVAAHSPWSGLPRLELRRISRASAEQRAGRAGRTAPGRVIRLYPLEDFLRRPQQETPAILREDLSRTLLELHALGYSPQQIPWLEAPPSEAWRAAERLLRELGALDEADRLTPIGQAMVRLPLEPRPARLLVEAQRRGATEEGCALAAILSAGERLPAEGGRSGPSDLFELLEQDWSPQVRRIAQQLRRAVGPTSRRRADETGLLISILTAFPDRVARRRRNDELLLAGGGSARLARSSVVRDAEFLVAVEVEERSDQELPLVRLASAVEPEWLLELFPQRFQESVTLEWNRAAERVEGVSALRFDRLVVLETRRSRVTGEQAERLLLEKALEAGLARFADPDTVDAFLARVEFAAGHAPLPRLGESDVVAALASLCRGRSSFGELEAAARDGGLLRALELRLSPEARQALDVLAPERLCLPSGRRVAVRYARGEPPSVSGKIQEFFGQRETPRIAAGKVPLVVHLLAPNHRPVQTTTDLEGFWERWYPKLRQELRRRYPRHAWPEDPLLARPSFR